MEKLDKSWGKRIALRQQLDAQRAATKKKAQDAALVGNERKREREASVAGMASDILDRATAFARSIDLTGSDTHAAEPTPAAAAPVAAPTTAVAAPAAAPAATPVVINTISITAPATNANTNHPAAGTTSNTTISTADYMGDLLAMFDV